jgi:signal transduction histidine kinase/phage shock protein PspC (stress-responsive transcriptional regulator)
LDGDAAVADRHAVAMDGDRLARPGPDRVALPGGAPLGGSDAAAGGDRLRRSGPDRMVLGVCGGLGEALGVDPVLLRLGFAAAVPLGGIGVAAYVMTAALMGAPPPGEAVARPRRRQLAGLAILLGVGLLTLGAGGLLLPIDVLAPSALLLVGLGLAWRQAATAGARGEGPGWARPLVLDALRALAAIALLIGGALLFLEQGTDITAAAASAIAAAVVAAGIGLLVGPRLRRAQALAGEERRERIRTEERALMAARLHDSVLQTLALIQRSEDARGAQRLARRQERELRAWLYGGEEPDAPATFAGALRRAIEDIEARYDVAVELVQPSDAPLDEDLEALVDAGREAVVNAAKHAGVGSISVLARATDREASVFVRDRGRGFDRAAVPRDRAGVRESIEARMARHGGRAAIHTAPGEGTEVELTLPRGARA